MAARAILLNTTAMLVLSAVAAAQRPHRPVPPGVGPLEAPQPATASLARANDDAPRRRPSTETWGPPGIDEVQLAVAPGIACPQQQVLDQITKHLNELMDSISRFDAVEHVLHEEHDNTGRLLSTARRKFAYIATLTPFGPGVPKIEEYRQSPGGPVDFPGGIATLGLPSLAFVFHSGMRDNFEITCRGMGEWQTRPAWVMQFRQREDRPNYLLIYSLRDGNHRADLKGRAWVAADSFQILHMEAELVRPLPAIRLLRHLQIVDYGVVRFQDKNTDLWLPKNAELYLYFHGNRYYRRHNFDQFRLFAVDVEEKAKLPASEDLP